MYAAIAKNGEPINGIKAGCRRPRRLCRSSLDDDNYDRERLRHDSATALRAFVISRANTLSSPNRARADGRVTNERVERVSDREGREELARLSQKGGLTHPLDAT